MHVRGETHVAIRWQRDPGLDPKPEGAWLRLEGQALDDAEHPLANAVVSFHLQAVETGDARVRPDLARAVSCAEAATTIPPGPGGGLSFETDSDGRFCMRMPLPSARYRVHAEAQWDPTHYDVVALEQELDFGKPPLSLWLEGSEGKLDLGKPSFALAARIGFEDFGRLVYASGLPVDWLDEQGRVLASATSNAEGHVHFEIATHALGDPGLVRHRLRCAGSPTLGPVEVIFPLEKRAHLELVLESAPRDVRAGVELPYEFRVRVVLAPGADPSRQLYAPQALVQATFADAQQVGTAEADAQGRALVPVLIASAAQSGKLEFRATAAVPFLVPSETLSLPVEVSAPQSWRSLWLLAGFLVLLAWLAIGRAPLRRKITGAKRAAAARTVAPAAARAEVVVTEESLGSAWNGSVHDAHDRTPVAGAQVSLVRPGFAGRALVLETQTSADGHFALDGALRQPGDRLVIQAPLHRTLDAAAPAFGTVTITTVSRRRGLLRDFARWAEGRPWTLSLRRKPTPLDAVVREQEHAAWAARVDAVVFGPEPVDASREASARVPEQS